MVRLLIAFLILVLTNVSYGQVIPDIDWQNCYGGSNGDQGFAIGLANDNDYVFAGNSSSTNADVTDNHGGGDIWVVRIDSNSNIEWQKCLGGTSFDDARSMISMPDGNFVIGGYTMSNDGDVSVHYGGDINRDFWIVKLNEFGNILWEKSLGGSNDDVPHSIIYNDLNEIITLGYTSSNDYDVIEYNGNTDVWLTLQNEAGEVQWTKCYGGSMSDNGYSVINAWDYGYLLVGSTYSNDIDVSGNHGESDMWVIKIDTIGNINWQKCIGGSGGDVGKSACKTLDGNYMIAGVTGSFDGDIEGNHGATDFFVAKLDIFGNFIWKKCYGGALDDGPSTIYPADDYGFIICGSSKSSNGDLTENKGESDYWVVKIDSIGDILWQKSLGGTFTDNATQMILAHDNSEIIIGITNSSDGDISGFNGGSDYWVVKLECTDPTTWYVDFDGDLYGSDSDSVISCITPLGYVTNNLDCNDTNFLINPESLEILDGIDNNCNELIDEGVVIIDNVIAKNIISIYPNPTRDNFTVSISDNVSIGLIRVSDINGEIILTKSFSHSTNCIEIDLSKFENGVYFVKLVGIEYEITQKIIKIN